MCILFNSLKAGGDTSGAPLSFEEAFLLGRSGGVPASINDQRVKSSTIVSGRNFELDEEDWC